MEFPDTIYVGFEKEESYADGGFLSVEKSAEELLEAGTQKRVAKYVLQEVMQGNLVPAFIAVPDKDVFANED